MAGSLKNESSAFLHPKLNTLLGRYFYEYVITSWPQKEYVQGYI